MAIPGAASHSNPDRSISMGVVMQTRNSVTGQTEAIDSSKPAAIVAGNMTPKGGCQLTDTQLASAYALSSATFIDPATGVAAVGGAGLPSGATMALLQAVAQDVIWTDDGSAPSTSNGIRVIAGQPPYPYAGDLTKLKMIRAAAGAILNVRTYG